MGNYEALNNRLIRQSARHLAIEVGLGIWVVRVCVHLSLCMYVPMCTCVGVDAQFPPTHTHIARSEEPTLEVLPQVLSVNIVFFFPPKEGVSQHILKLPGSPRMSNQQCQESSCLHFPNTEIAGT